MKYKILLFIFIICVFPAIGMQEDSKTNKTDTTIVTVSTDSIVRIYRDICIHVKTDSINPLYGSIIDTTYYGGKTVQGKGEKKKINLFNKNVADLIRYKGVVVSREENGENNIKIEITFQELEKDSVVIELPYAELTKKDGYCIDKNKEKYKLTIIKSNKVDSIPSHNIEKDNTSSQTSTQPVSSQTACNTFIAKLSDLFLDKQNVISLGILIILLFLHIIFFIIFINKISKIVKKQKYVERELSELEKNNNQELIKKSSTSDVTITEGQLTGIVNTLLAEYKKTVEELQKRIPAVTTVEQNDVHISTDTSVKKIIEKKEIDSYSNGIEKLISNEVSYDPTDKSFRIERNEMSIFKIYSRGEHYFYTLVEKEDIRRELMGLLSSYTGCIEWELKSKAPQRVIPVKDGRLRKDGNKFCIITSELLKVELV